MKPASHRLFALLYDPIMWIAERAAFGRFRQELLGEVRGDVLEVGAGTGLNFPHYAPSVHVRALEPDPAMMRRARKRVRRSAAQITLELAGDERLAMLPPDSFDAIVFTLVLCTVEDPDAALLAARRLLRRDGRLIIIEHVRSPGRLGAVQDLLRPLWERCGAGCQLNRNTAAALRRAGFETATLRTQRIPGGIIRDVLLGVAPMASHSGEADARTPSTGQKP